MKKNILSVLLSSLMLIFIFNKLPATYAIDDSTETEIVSLRSEYGKCFDNGDGTITTFINTIPMHYYNGSEWIDINNSLIYENGSYTNTDNSMKVTLAENTSVSSINTNKQMVQIELDGYKIGWNLINDYNKDMSLIDFSTSNIEIENNKEIELNLVNDKIKDNINDKANKLVSSATYSSLYDNVDIDIEVKPKSVKESIILNNCNIPEKFMYFIQSNGLEATIYDDNTVHFYDNENEIFMIPSPYMFDSSGNLENNYNIDVEMEKYKNGYIYTVIPDKMWLMDENRVYPVIIDPEFVSNYKNVSTTYNSEKNPNLTYDNDNCLIGGEVGDRYETIVYAPESFAGSQFKGDIINATFNMYFVSNDRPGNNSKIEVHYLEECSPDWNSSGGGESSSSALISSLGINEYSMGYKSFDITKLVQYWANYSNTDGTVGIHPYGFKLKSSIYPSNSRIFCGLSERNSSHTPYFEVTHKIEKYASTYNTNKYDNYNNVNNFKYKMNCYSYALQMYYKGDGNYSLLAGELGIGQEDDGIYSYGDLQRKYYSYKNVNEFNEFVDKQMKKDAKALNYSIINLNKEYNINSQDSFVQYINQSYNKDNGRIIALVSGWSNFSGIFDYHYYMRHGNGTCPEHGGNCSIWSHKLSYNNISCYSLNGNPVLCDETIFANSTPYVSSYSSGPIFYNIGKNMNVYNSYYYGHGSNGGTSFVYIP